MPSSSLFKLKSVHTNNDANRCKRLFFYRYCLCCVLVLHHTGHSIRAAGERAHAEERIYEGGSLLCFKAAVDFVPQCMNARTPTKSPRLQTTTLSVRGVARHFGGSNLLFNTKKMLQMENDAY